MALPNFLIVGAAKSGTTSLYHYLSQHPDIFLPYWKEPSYFIDDNLTSVKSFEEYRSLFSGASSAKAVGEASPVYIDDENAPRKIFERLGPVKIIAILRNPADRAYSMWKMNALRHGFEEPSFEKALEKEPGRMADPEFRKKSKVWHRKFYYFDNGLYYVRIKRFLDMFGPENVKVLIFEEMKERPLETCREIFAFLGVDESFEPVIKMHNPASAYRFQFYEKILFRLRHNAVVHRLFNMLPPRAKSLFYQLVQLIQKINNKPLAAAEMDDGLRKTLLGRYLEDIHKLEHLIGKDLSVWYGCLNEDSGRYRPA